MKQRWVCALGRARRRAKREAQIAQIKQVMERGREAGVLLAANFNEWADRHWRCPLCGEHANFEDKDAASAGYRQHYWTKHLGVG
jgi:hypothetical protein